MTMLDSGYSEAAASLFIWVADKTVVGVKKAFGWSWDQVAWAKAQDRYDAEIIRQHGTIRIFGQTTPKPLREIYTDVFVLDTPTAHRRFGPEQLAQLAVHLWNEDRGLSFRHAERQPGIDLLDSGTQFFILGKPGAGKTTFLKYLAVREARRGAWGRCLGKLPIFVPLRQYADAGKSLFDFIVEQFDVCHFPGNAAPFVNALLASGRALVMFDGLDEVVKSDAEDRRGAVTAELMTFARTYSRCHILITCRIAAIDTTLDAGFVYLEMADFVPAQVDHFVRAWFSDAGAPDVSARLAQEMLDELARPDHAGIRDLGRSPLLLTLLCLNYAETLTFPARRVEIYEEALDALLKKWDSSRQIRRGGLYKTLSLGRKRQMFARIAYDAFARNEIVFPQPSLEAWLKAYLVNVPEPPAAVDIDAEAVLQEIVEQHGIFAEQARHLFSFAHLTFQEYYAASHIAESMNAGVLDTLLAHVSDAKWREVFLLTASLLPDATDFLDNMLRAVNGMVVTRASVKALVQAIGKRAGESQAGYGRPAIRLYFFARARARGVARDLAFDLDRARDLAFDLDRARDLAFDLDRARYLDRDRDLAHDLAHELALTLALTLALDFDRDLDLDRDLACACDRDFAFDLDRARDLDRDLVSVQKDLLARCRQQGRVTLHDALAAIQGPADSAELDAWQVYADNLTAKVEASDELAAYRCLQAEAEALVKAQPNLLQSMREADVSLMADYITATKLFHECLQVAYTADRRALEDRILTLPA